MDPVTYQSIDRSALMNIPLRLLLVALTVAALSTADLRSNALGQQTHNKRARPPKFDPREVEQIFFTDARKALVGERPASLPAKTAGQRNGGTVPSPSNGAEASPLPEVAARWSKLISAETLVDEIKSYPPLLAAVVKTPSQFQGKGAREARRYFSTIAALFAIIAEYDREVRWKSQAGAARELFARAGFNSKSDNENVYNEAKQRAADLAALLRGETLAAPPNIEIKPNFNEQVANRPPLMWRLERAQRDRLAVWTANRADFNRNLAGIKHEAEIVAALSQVIQDPTFLDADSESYGEYARALQQSALAIRQAADRKDADAARQAAGLLSKACNDCHADFRGE